MAQSKIHKEHKWCQQYSCIIDICGRTKLKKFSKKKPVGTLKDDWLDDRNTPFFLKSSGSPFQYLDLKYVSESIGIDVTTYSFRHIVST